MVVKIYKNGKDNDGDNDKLSEKITNQKQHAGYGQHQNPADMKGPKCIAVFVNIV